MKVRYLFFAIPLLFLAGCQAESCFSEAGAVVRVTRAVAAFHEIDIYQNINLVLTQDTVETLTIEAPQHLEPNIVASVSDGVLTLKNEGTCTWLRKPSEKIIVYVHLKKLNKIMYAGSGNITSANTLVADNITFYSKEGAGNIEVWLQAVQTFSYIMDESADIVLHGTSERCWTYTSSRGTIDFSDFAVKSMEIDYGALRDATINVSEELKATIYYKGNLLYKGDPVVTKNEVHSSGRLVHVP